MNDFGGFFLGAFFGFFLAFVVPSSSVSEAQLITASSMCAENNGIQSMRGPGIWRDARIICKNSATFYIASIKFADSEK